MDSRLPASSSIPSTTHPATRLRGGWLHLARLVWLVTAGMCLMLLAWISPPSRGSFLFEPLVSESYWLISSVIGYREYVAYILILRYLVMGVFFSLAVLIAWRKSDDWLALLTSITIIGMPYIMLFGGLLYNQNQYNPTRWGKLMSYPDGYLSLLGLASFFLLLLVFPDGRFATRKWGRIFMGGLVLLSISTVLTFTVLEDAWVIYLTLFLVILAAGIFGQVYRYFRISSTGQRAQTRWVILSILVNLVWVISAALIRASDLMRSGSAAYYGLFELHFSLLLISLVPLSLAIAVLRYHLYDIDLIIRRTLVYSALTALLIGLYFGAVTVLQAVFSSVIGQQSNLAIALSTLAAAGLFNPLRKRIQEFIDRRFYRKKYDAQQILESFSANARNEVELSRLSEELVRAASDTLKPDKVSLWIKKT